MAKRRRKKATTHRKARKSLAAAPRRRRRRRLGAGDKMFRMVSNPIIGGVAGAVTGMILNNIVSKIAKGNQMIGLIVPVGGGVFLQKKAPFFAAGLVAGTAISVTKDFVAKLPAGNFMHKLLGDDAQFVNDNLLQADNPIILSADGQEIPYRLSDMLMEEMADIYGGDSMNDED